MTCAEAMRDGGVVDGGCPDEVWAAAVLSNPAAITKATRYDFGIANLGV
jgi:hypothetical protein